MVLPAPAGMSPFVTLTSYDLESPPRASGDEPVTGRVTLKPIESSPRQRG